MAVKPEDVTFEQFAAAYARTPHAAWRHLLAVRGDGEPQPLSAFWETFRLVATEDPEDPDDGRWLAEVMAVLGLGNP